MTATSCAGRADRLPGARECDTCDWLRVAAVEGVQWRGGVLLAADQGMWR